MLNFIVASCLRNGFEDETRAINLESAVQLIQTPLGSCRSIQAVKHPTTTSFILSTRRYQEGIAFISKTSLKNAYVGLKINHGSYARSRKGHLYVSPDYFMDKVIQGTI